MTIDKTANIFIFFKPKTMIVRSAICMTWFAFVFGACHEECLKTDTRLTNLEEVVNNMLEELSRDRARIAELEHALAATQQGKKAKLYYFCLLYLSNIVI